MANLVKEFIEKQGRNYSAIARLVGVTPAAVGSWVHGRAKPRLKTARKLKKYCDMPLSLWGYEDKPEQPQTNVPI